MKFKPKIGRWYYYTEEYTDDEGFWGEAANAIYNLLKKGECRVMFTQKDEHIVIARPGDSNPGWILIARGGPSWLEARPVLGGQRQNNHLAIKIAFENEQLR